MYRCLLKLSFVWYLLLLLYEPSLCLPEPTKRNFCRSIVPKNGQVVSCHSPQTSNLKINCTLDMSPEFSVATLRCDDHWLPKPGSVSTLNHVCVNRHWVRDTSEFACVPKFGVMLETDTATDRSRKRRESFTPVPFLGTTHSKIRPNHFETFSLTRTSGDESNVPPTQHRGHGFLFYPVLPTRFPISTRLPKPPNHTTKRSISTATESEAEVSEIDNSNPSSPGKCPALPKINGVIQTCQRSDSDNFDECSQGGNLGTISTSKCMDHYVSGFGPASIKKECLDGGQWSNTRSLICNLECGISAQPRRTFIANGQISDRISWPWHATIFRKVGNDFRYVCGGTLISKSVVLTAAHCLTLSGTSVKADEKEFLIMFGSISSNYTENLLDPISKLNLFNVKSIVLPDSYNGVTFDSDIALLQLEFEVELSHYVLPVCFPFQTKENEDLELLQLSPGTLGQTVGFGLVETGKPSETLKEARLPVVSHRDCGDVLARLPSSFQFCAGYLNGTGVCNGDSGSGLYFSVGTGYMNRYIIQGIVSFGESSGSQSKVCNHNTYAVFTRVSKFSTWVEAQLDTLEPSQ